jgi:hypothetical protein
MTPVVGTSGPRRVHEGVMEMLLHIIYDPLLKIARISAEQSNPCGGLSYYRFVPRSDGAGNIIEQEANHPSYVTLGDAACFFKDPTTLLARTTVRNAIANCNVPGTKQLSTKNAEGVLLKLRKEFATNRTSGWSGVYVHTVSRPANAKALSGRQSWPAPTAC